MAASSSSAAVPLLVVMAAVLFVPQSNGQPPVDHVPTDKFSCYSNMEWETVCDRCQASCPRPAAAPCNTDHVCMPRCMCPDALPVWDGLAQECVADAASCATPGARSIFRPQDFQSEEPLQVGPCHGGQLWLECGSACPKLCNEPAEEVCNLNCVSGCQCLPGMEWHDRLQFCYHTGLCPHDNVKDECFGRDLVFALDASGSVHEDHFDRVKRFVRRFVEKLLIGGEFNRVSIITYSTEAFVQVELGAITEKTALLAVIDDLQYIGQRTNTSGAVRAIHSEFRRAARRETSQRVAIVMSDGKSNTDEGRLFSDVEAARKDNIRFHAFGIGSHADLYEMAIIANLPLFENVFFGSHDYVLDQHDLFFGHICKRNVYSSPEVTYSIGKTPGVDLYAGNIIFVVDAATSLRKEEFDLQVRLIKEVVRKLDVQYLRKFAVVQFGVGAGITHLPFTAYETIVGFLYEIEDRIRYDPQDVDVAAGLEHIETLLDDALESGVVTLETLKPQVVMMTSGRDLYNVHLFKPKLAALKRKYADFHLMPVEIQTDLTPEQRLAATEWLKVVSKDNLELLTRVEQDEVSEQLAHYVAWLIAANAALPIFTCDFEKVVDGKLKSSMCDLHQLQTTDDFDWLVSDGPTLSLFTGPEKAANGTYYAYIEATDRQPGDQAVLLGPTMDYSGLTCIRFKYHMHGWHSGTLEVVHYLPGYAPWAMWQMSGEQGDAWHEGMIQSFVVHNSRFGFRATVGGGYSSDIAMDMLQLTLGPCPEMRQFVRDERMTLDEMAVDLDTVQWYGSGL